MPPNSLLLSLFPVAVIWVAACSPSPDPAIVTELQFRIGSESGITAARDLTVDLAGNVFIFDYDDYVVTKFDASGMALVDFGGAGPDAGPFQHLMAIRAIGDSLLALDAGALHVFDLSGQPRSVQPFADTVTCDFPRIREDGHWAGEWFVEETAEYALTSRNPDGTEAARVASYSLGDLYPGIEPGGMFFIQATQARRYLYEFLPDGRLVWMASDRIAVMTKAQRQERVLFEAEASAIPYPEAEIALLTERQAGLSAPLFMNVPGHYQLAHHLNVDEDGGIWIYVISVEWSGFIHLSGAGEELGFHPVVADFDLLDARVTVGGGRLYFLVPEDVGAAIYSAVLPH